MALAKTSLLVSSVEKSCSVQLVSVQHVLVWPLRLLP
jgi:hypothetical protein